MRKREVPERKPTVGDLIKLLRTDSEAPCMVHVIPRGEAGYEGELFGRSDSNLWDSFKDMPVRRIVPSVLKDSNEPMLFIWLDSAENAE